MIERIKKENLLKFLPDELVIEYNVNPHRVYEISKPKENPQKFICLLTRSFRIEDNFTVNYAKEISNDNFEVVFLKPKIENRGKKDFFDSQFQITLENFSSYKTEIFEEKEELINYLKEQKALLIRDFNPINEVSFENIYGIIEADSSNICPARYISTKQEYNAASLRRKIYAKIWEFLTIPPSVDFKENGAYINLRDFIENRLSEYARYKNNPTYKAVSNLSKYLNYGFISPQRIAIEVIKSENSDENKEVFLEELIVRKELSDNFCLYNKNYASFDGLPEWGQRTLNEHREDLRTNIFTLEELELAKSYDDLWNASQHQLLKEGKIHGYMRMYWAKKILEWTESPEKAIEYAIYLNDKYAYDAPSPNGYTGILWSIGGLHDRPFIEKPVTGEIRSMTYNGAKSKFDVQKYINEYLPDTPKNFEQGRFNL